MGFSEYYEAALRLGWFDPCFYLVARQSRGLSLPDGDLSLFGHYATIGWKHGVSPSERFSVERYLAHDQDAKVSQMDPLYHFLASGRSERRLVRAAEAVPATCHR